MKLPKNPAVYVLALALIVSSSILASSSGTSTKSPEKDLENSSYVSTSKYKEDMGLLVKEVIDLQMQIANMQGRTTDLEDCLRQTTVTLTQNQQNIFVCP